jgi:uncharacterized protein YerC
LPNEIETMKASVKQIVKMLQAGMTPRLIQKKFPGTGSANISYRRRLLSMPPFRPGGPSGPRNLTARIKARGLRKKGWTYAKIGAVLGVSRQRVHQYLSETAKPVGS